MKRLNFKALKMFLYPSSFFEVVKCRKKNYGKAHEMYHSASFKAFITFRDRSILWSSPILSIKKGRLITTQKQ